MIITIAGAPGSGKTSVAKELAERLGYNFISVGDLLGQIAIERKITADELKAMGPEADRLIDAKQIEFAKTHEDGIIEGWISWKLIPDSFKILVTVDPDEGARRVFAETQSRDGKRQDERMYESVEDAKRTLAKRVENHLKRMQEVHGIDCILKPENFDFVLDTTDSPGPTQNADKIMDAMRRRGLI